MWERCSCITDGGQSTRASRAQRFQLCIRHGLRGNNIVVCNVGIVRCSSHTIISSNLMILESTKSED